MGGFNSTPGFFVIAHRGASFSAPENTMPAFNKAIEMKADMIELDVLPTRDNIPIVLHDEKLNRTTTGEGPVAGTLFRELQELDAGSWFDPSFKNTKIPSLETVLKWAKNKIALNIEIKGNGRRSGESDLESQIIEMIDHYDMRDHVVISSFRCNAIRQVKKSSPTTSTALLNWKYSYGTRRVYLFMRYCKADGLNILARQMKDPLMNLLKKNHVPVWIYTVNNEQDMRIAIRKGATGIITDRPDLLRRVTLDEIN
ncbi:glycerophosphodiester phosphodiesterase [soil metagenome]